MGGSENKPVRLSTILTFSKMKKFGQRSKLVAALRDCVYVNVSEDRKWIQRKRPFIIDNEPDDPDDVDDEWLKKRGKVRKSDIGTIPAVKTSSRGRSKPTGFEEFYTDSPVTPAEYADERTLYDEHNLFPYRIEAAIQRYREKRKFHPEPANIFSTFLRFGGIESGPRLFGGIGQREREDMDAEQIARANAIDFVGDDKDDTDRWAVDFEGCAKGFL